MSVLDTCVEFLHAFLKKEEVYRTQYVTFKQTNLALFQCIKE
ncbi:hypothetical protein EMIT079MI2_40043 [Bacillus sp. IT-79MI2]